MPRRRARRSKGRRAKVRGSRAGRFAPAFASASRGDDDGVFRIGNAAGEAHPIVGEGISMALQSAFVLAALIGPARARLVGPAVAREAQRTRSHAYEAVWRRRFTRRLRVAAAFAHVAMRPALAAPPGRWRDAGRAFSPPARA